ncbi:2-acylglycerophosphoethanolamine acyltransferase / Acyl-[acyl-carrier-protein] synthetase [hydrothermal vent metagenome]|uniref:2-acylglycerophosphoethanolamine acyltransferase / Acyl-[acyl-carrier-protein] synthetase n=1 Tax=hydrothermal vent metagenome TaxID=652676 RepID=A0A3B0VNQ7_9ZZZZ
MKGLFKFFAKRLFKALYRVEVKGLEHYHAVDQSQQPLLIIANHVSSLDGPLIDLFLPGETCFMVDAGHTKKWHERFILSMTNYFKVDLQSPYAAKHMIKELKKGKQCMIFPEGRITTTGHLMKVYEGTGMVADKTDAMVLPVNISGAVYSKFSYLDGTRFAYIKQFWFPKITLTIRPAEKMKETEGLSGHQKHRVLTQQISGLLRDGLYYSVVRPQTIFAALLQAKSSFREKETCIEDINGQELSLKKLTLASIILGKQLQKILKNEKHVGLMLPNVSGMPASFFALQAYGYIPAMINFTAGIGSIKSACKTAELKTVITSKKFVDLFELESLIEALSQEVRFVYLEDIKENITGLSKISGLLTCPQKLPGYRASSESPAVILFTSGSEGVPKGVMLSHQNINSNIAQICAMITLLPGDTILNALPTFHCFGLTAGMLWPIMRGAKVYLYPSPIHYSVVPEMAYQKNVRLMFGTDTFYSGYARKAHFYDFYSVDILVSGAERLRSETRDLYADKYHKPIFEGYGVTETTPVLSINTPLAYKNGSVGQFVPDIIYRLQPVEGISEGGRLFVKGPNIMLGYLMADNPSVLQSPKEGWHDTGDIVDVDDEGYIWIKGRAKRFAKIGGEMVSLTAVEAYIGAASPEGHHVVIAVPDKRKGERLVLVTDDATLCRSTITNAAKKKELAELMIPKTTILVEKVPVLGTGKTNYPEVQKLVEQNFD